VKPHFSPLPRTFEGNLTNFVQLSTILFLKNGLSKSNVFLSYSRMRNLVLTAFILISEAVFASEWENIADVNFINDCVEKDRKLFLATSGGIVEFDPYSGDWRVFTNIDGVAGLDVNCVALSPSGELWYGSSNGALGYLSGGGFINFPDFRFSGIGINDVCPSGDVFWLATSKGISLFRRMSDFQVGEIVGNFWSLGELSRESPIFSVVLFDGRIWGGGEGVVVAADTSYETVNLSAPDSWESFGVSGRVNQLFAWGGALFAGTSNGIYRLEDTVFSLVGLERDDVFGFFVRADSLYATTAWGVYRSADGENWRRLLSAPKKAHCGLMLADTAWVGYHRGYGFITDEEVTRYVFPSPCGYGFSGLYISGDDIYLAAKPYGASYRKDGEWVSLTTYNPMPNGEEVPVGSRVISSWAILPDRNGAIWIGTWGQGLLVMYPDDNLWSVFADSTGPISTARGAGVDYEVIPKLGEDSDGNIWAFVFDPANDTAIVVWSYDALVSFPYPEPDSSNAYFFTRYELSSANFQSFLFDSGKLWLGYIDGGLDCLDYGGTLSDKSDDVLTHFSTDDGLPSNVVNDLALDDDGRLWIATDQGLCYYDPSYDFIQEVALPNDLSLNVLAVAIDRWGDKWVGTSDGACIIFADNASSQTIRSKFSLTGDVNERSGLLSDYVSDIHIDDDRGVVTFVTDRGVSSLSITEVGDGEVSLVVYPNPFVIEYGSAGELTVSGVPLDAEVFIYTSSGELVRYFPKWTVGFDAKVRWDGRNGSGELVSSGIYIVVARGASSTGKAKFAIVR